MSLVGKNSGLKDGVGEDAQVYGVGCMVVFKNIIYFTGIILF